MAHYIDGFVVPVPKKKLAAYRAMARKCSKVWKEHGAMSMMKMDPKKLPFDGKRMFWGGFKAIVEA